MKKKVTSEMKLLFSFITFILVACLTSCGVDSGKDGIYYADVNGTIFEITDFTPYSTNTYALYLKNPYAFTTNDGKVVTTSKLYVSNINVIIYGDCTE